MSCASFNLGLFSWTKFKEKNKKNMMDLVANSTKFILFFFLFPINFVQGDTRFPNFWGNSPPPPPPGETIFKYAVSSMTNTIIIASVISVIGSIVVAVLIYMCCKEHGQGLLNLYAQILTTPVTSTAVNPYEMVPMETVENFLIEIAGEKPVRFLPQQLADITRNYKTKLGKGGFGEVYKGELPNRLPVAVKVLHSNLDKRAEEQFMAEVGTIGRTYHINLVRLYGFCFDQTVRALVYEYMENGSLDKYLFQKDCSLNWETLHEIAVGTAKGIRYLHEECQQRIIHYDIKPGNILLDANFRPKVADFGLAKLISRENTHVTLTGGRGTPGYAAPEMWMPSPVTHKCDVYSFGMLLFEIVGRRRNLNVTSTESEQWFPKVVYDKFEIGQLPEIVLSCGIEEEKREEAERMCKVALWCVQYSAEARPPMGKVVKMLEGEMEIAPPMNPFQHLCAVAPGSNLWSESGKDSTSGGFSETTPIMKKYDIERATTTS